jgi:predicted nuclease with TOPRIM domain
MRCSVYNAVIVEVLEMEAPMSDWNDERLDHLDRRVDEGFKRMDKEFAKVDERFKQVDKRLERIEDRFDRLNYTLITGAIGIIVALIGFHG